MASITGSTAIFQLAVINLFPIPVRLQGFAADDIFDTDDIEPNEVLMGVDGILSGGRVNVPVAQTIHLQADSQSNQVFDQWNAAEQALQDSYIANGIVTLTGLGLKWTLTRGFLTRYKPIPQAKKLLQPRTYRITWNLVSPAPV